MDEYSNRLAGAKVSYQFLKWTEWGIEQHTDDAINLFASVFDNLIEQLATAGEQAPETDKLAAFRQAVQTLNRLVEKDKVLIETDEREDLCELFNVIAIAARIDPRKYGDGDGPASEWRDW